MATLVGRDPLADLLAGRLTVLVLRFPRVLYALLQALKRQHATVPASGLTAGAKQRRWAGPTAAHELAAQPDRKWFGDGNGPLGGARLATAVVGAEVDHSEVQVHITDACVADLSPAGGRVHDKRVWQGVGDVESI